MRRAGGARTHRQALNSDAATRMIAPGAAAGWMGSGRYGATQAELGQSAASYLKQRKQRALKMMVNSLLGLLRTPATQSRIKIRHGCAGGTHKIVMRSTVNATSLDSAAHRASTA